MSLSSRPWLAEQQAIWKTMGPACYPGENSRRKLQNVVTDSWAQARPGEHLPGASEAIESLIGKGKRLEGQHSKGGFTRIVLGMAAAVVQPTIDDVQQAFEQVKTKDVLAWARRNLGPSLHFLRRQTLGRITAEQIQDKFEPVYAPDF